MDRTIKFLLGVIAASLLMLNLQLAGVSLVKDAHASTASIADALDISTIAGALDNIAGALDNIMRAILTIDCGS